MRIDYVLKQDAQRAINSLITVDVNGSYGTVRTAVRVCASRCDPPRDNHTAKPILWVSLRAISARDTRSKSYGTTNH